MEGVVVLDLEGACLIWIWNFLLFLKIQVTNGQLTNAPLFQRAFGQNFATGILFKIARRPNNYVSGVDPPTPGKWLWVRNLNVVTLCAWYLDLGIYVYSARAVSYASCLLLIWYLVYFDAFFTLILWYFDIVTLILVLMLWWNFDFEKILFWNKEFFKNLKPFAFKKRTKINLTKYFQKRSFSKK